MIAVRMVKMAVHEVIHVIAMRHGFMPATGAMHMSWLMSRAAVAWRAVVRICRAHFDHVLIDMIAMGMMKMAIMQIVHVVAMTNGGMTAAGAVLMIVIGVVRKIAGTHDLFLSCSTLFGRRLGRAFDRVGNMGIGAG
ncbi:MAG TPA: hypothetical protein VMB73_34945 [Acetobacteraceae bacterium]|jgi:hypothetical protein|nr:hypothetical protein [Acetobacteraceae bacterium]